MQLTRSGVPEAGRLDLCRATTTPPDATTIRNPLNLNEKQGVVSDVPDRWLSSKLLIFNRKADIEPRPQADGGVHAHPP